MVKKGIVLSHMISSDGIEVDKANINLIANLSAPIYVKDVRYFFEHVGFIIDLFKISVKLLNPCIVF